jgi:signal transduction histidine kinase
VRVTRVGTARRRRPLVRELAAWAALAAAIAAAILWRAGNIRDLVADEVNTTHAVTTRALLVRVTDWGQARVAHVEAVAALLADDIAPARADSVRAVTVPFARAMDVFAQRETFVAGRVLDRAGRVLASVDVRRPPGPSSGAEGVAQRERGAVGVPVKRVRTVTVPCGRDFCVEFHAPMWRGADHVGTVVLVATVDDSTFRPLNASRPGIRTGRTSVLAPLGSAGADTFAVVASLGAPGSPEPAPQRPVTALPAAIRRALAAPPGRIVADTGAGLHGGTVHYAVGRVPELDWVVDRELDRAELLAIAQRGMLVEEPILVALLLSVVVIVRSRLRAGRARREQELTRLRADFVASTSHELRTPLAQIRMFAELLQRGTLRRPEEAARALRIIEKEASRLTILVDNLLNYTRLRRRAEHSAVESLVPTHVAGDVQQVIEAFAPLAAERGARVLADVPDDLHAHVDSLALRQVLINYLENAVKYGPAGQTVLVGASGDERRVRIWVDDQGRGVPREERQAVWEAFRRGAQAEASAQGGSGIGLAVVREIALQHRGDVALEDAPGGGARFVAEFPRASGVNGAGDGATGA